MYIRGCGSRISSSGLPVQVLKERDVRLQIYIFFEVPDKSL